MPSGKEVSRAQVCASGRVMTAHERTSEKGTQQQQQQHTHTQRKNEREREKNESFDQIIKSGTFGGENGEQEEDEEEEAKKLKIKRVFGCQLCCTLVWMDGLETAPPLSLSNMKQAPLLDSKKSSEGQRRAMAAIKGRPRKYESWSLAGCWGSKCVVIGMHLGVS